MAIREIICYFVVGLLKQDEENVKDFVFIGTLLHSRWRDVLIN